MIKVTNSIDWKLWDEFVYNHPHGNIFQTSYMSNVYKNTKNYEPISLVAIDSEEGRILAVLQAVIIKESQGIIGLITGRSVITGGPLYIEQEEGYEAVEKLLEHYEAIVRQKVVYTQIRNMWDTVSVKNVFQSAGYDYEDHLNYLIDLSQSPEQIWQNIKKSRKGDIKNAEKNGINVNKIESLNEIKEFYFFIKETYKKSRLPLADISLFESSFIEFAPKSMVDFYLAVHNGNAVGSCVMLRYKNTILNWYMGSEIEAKFVDGALIWHILKKNASKEKIFDFGGAGHPEKPYGVRDFKRRFGGMEVNYGRYEKVHNKNKKELMNLGLNAYKKLNLSKVF